MRATALVDELTGAKASEVGKVAHTSWAEAAAPVLLTDVESFAV